MFIPIPLPIGFTEALLISIILTTLFYLPKKLPKIGYKTGKIYKKHIKNTRNVKKKK